MNMKAKWIKINTDMLHNRKIVVLRYERGGNDMILLWFYLLILAGQVNDGGLIYFTETRPYDANKLSRELNIAEPVVNQALEFFKDNDMINVDDNNMIQILNWGEYQNADQLEKIRESNRLRQQRHYVRTRQTNIENNATPNVIPNVSITETIALGKNKEKKEKNQKKNKETNEIKNKNKNDKQRMSNSLESDKNEGHFQILEYLIEKQIVHENEKRKFEVMLKQFVFDYGFINTFQSVKYVASYFNANIKNKFSWLNEAILDNCEKFKKGAKSYDPDYLPPEVIEIINKEKKDNND